MFSPPVRLALLPALFITASALGQGITPSPTPADTPAPVMADLAPAGTTISGVVMSDKEENNEGLPGALVSAINLTTGTQITVPTNGEGRFELKNLQPGGPYIVQVRQEGFRPLSVTNIYLTAGRDTPLTLTLTTETVAVGTRRADRGALESAVPVDVIDMAAQAQRAPGTDATQLLNYAVPSFNATRQTNAGGADFVELGSLRGLGTDQLLVLVNGKRRHTTALLGLLGNRGVGTVGTDLNTLPSNAIDRVEILRDGAAAQYGSDAIAGVMNIALKSNNHGGTVLASAGLTSQGDGFASSLSVSKGLKLGENGFLSITAGADQRQPTTRGYARNGVSSPVFSFDPATEVLALARAGKTYADYTQRNGDARTNNYRLLLNASAQATSKLKIYGFGGYNYRTGQAQAPWVLPATQPQNIVSAIFPNGYAPLINTRIHDASGAVGAVYDLGGYSLDVSHTVGYNQMRYDVENTLKPSDDKLTATAFQAGGYQFTQNVTNVTLNHLYSKVLAGTNVALGGELRTDQYAIVEGELNSYGYSGDINPAAAAGSQGFTGFSDASAEASKGSRRNVGAFLDVEADVTKKWLVSTALRFENYTDFGSAFIYKATTRYQVARQVAVRGAFNTGFRAPSLQQVLYRQTISSQGISSGIFNNLDEVTKAAGIEPLEAEKSRSYSAGLVLTPAAGLTFTADGYLIDIDNRLLLTGLLTGQAPVMPGGNGDALYNVLRTKSVSGARFFTNGADTRTQGIDLVARYTRSLNRGTLTVNAGANFTRTTVERVIVPPLFKETQNDDNLLNNFVDDRELSLLETGSPASKILLHLGYEQGKFNVLLRNTYFGRVSYFDTNSDLNNTLGSYKLVFKPRVVTDLLVTYSPVKPLAITLGVNNLLNVLPSTISEAAANGELPKGFSSAADYDLALRVRGLRPQPEGRDVYTYAPVQMGSAGAFGYLKVAYNFGL